MKGLVGIVSIALAGCSLGLPTDPQPPVFPRPVQGAVPPGYMEQCVQFYTYSFEETDLVAKQQKRKHFLTYHPSAMQCYGSGL